MLFLNRTTALAFDDMLAGLDGGNTGAGSAYGVFNNSEQMALNLGFSGFRRAISGVDSSKLKIKKTFKH